MCVFSCNSFDSIVPLETKEACHIVFPSKQAKELVLKFPFEMYEEKSFVIVFSAEQPRCKMFYNKSLEVLVCHKYFNKNEYFPSKNRIELRNNTEKYRQNEIERVSKKYKIPSTFKMLQLETTIMNNSEVLKYGFIQNSGNNRV